MPRNKTVKQNTKRRKMDSPLANSQKMEADFADGPAKLIIQLNKEVAALKKKEKKLLANINKVNAQVKKSVTRLQVAEKVKNVAARKKQLNIAKKAHDATLSMQNDLSNQHQEMTEFFAIAANKHDKITAISKHLNQFEKEWAKKIKQSKTNKHKSKIKKALPKPQATTTSPSLVEPQSASLEPTIDNMRLDETAEMVS